MVTSLIMILLLISGAISLITYAVFYLYASFLIQNMPLSIVFWGINIVMVYGIVIMMYYKAKNILFPYKVALILVTISYLFVETLVFIFVAVLLTPFCFAFCNFVLLGVFILIITSFFKIGVRNK